MNKPSESETSATASVVGTGPEDIGPSDERGSKLYLVAIGHDGLYTSHPLPEEGTVTVGRSRESDIPLRSYRSISRRHARLRIGGELHLENLSSKSYTQVRNQRLRIGEEVVIAAGEIARLGPVMVFVQRLAAPVQARRLDLTASHPRLPVPSPEALDLPRDSPMVDLLAQVERVAPSDERILILGETGSGKDWLAKEIHRLSSRRDEAMWIANCAAIPEQLFESEVFGNEQTPYTGPKRLGLVEQYSRGTLVLDEFGELTPRHQAKLLTFLDEKKFMRVGGTKVCTADPRIIATTNRDLRAEIAARTFRGDLFARIGTIVLRVPPLRERRSEILPLAKRFLREARKGRSPVDISPEAAEVMLSYAWPFNVRELRSTMVRAALECGGGPLGVEHLGEDILAGISNGTDDPNYADRTERRPVTVPPTPLPDLKPDVRPTREALLVLLDRFHWVITDVARHCGVSTKTIYNWMHRQEIPVKSER